MNSKPLHYYCWDDKNLYLKFLLKLLFYTFCTMAISEDILLTVPYNLHIQSSCTDSNKCFISILNNSLFWDTRFLSSQQHYGLQFYWKSKRHQNKDTVYILLGLIVSNFINTIHSILYTFSYILYSCVRFLFFLEKRYFSEWPLKADKAHFWLM